MLTSDLKQDVKKNLKGTWKQALASFLSPILFLLMVRWLLVEPFVIPSGSMIPTLLIHDHIFVNKMAYGVRFPFTDYWLLNLGTPQRGDVVVFKYPVNPDLFFIKRLIGLPGDTVEIKNRVIFVNGQEFKQLSQKGGIESEHGQVDESTDSEEKAEFSYYVEKIDSSEHKIQFYSRDYQNDLEDQVFHVPEGQYFFMGDNRDQSSDSRVWGFVPRKYLIGRALFIWLSCEQMLENANFACDPSTMRWDRLFKGVH